MGRVVLCIGKRAENPYFFDKTCQNIYSIEELCYVFGENAYLLDEDIVDKWLVKWIEDECKLTELARNLYTMLNQKVSAVAFVGTILEYTGYFSKEKIMQIEAVLKNGKNLSLFERKKAKADYLVKRKKFALAVTEYDSLIKELEGQDPVLLAKVRHNKGVAQTGLFAYEYASGEFLKAYELSGSEEDYMAYLAAKRMYMEDQDYIRFMSEHTEGYEISLVLEKQINKILEQWQTAPEREHMDVLFDYKENGNRNLYYREVEKLINELKQDYRECVTN
ncbi:MAG: hypothetical protein IJN54_10305 [Lachnospiraceae bacterium]|nr:hypothetical protein [Lachnospiraceae bacterium]